MRSGVIYSALKGQCLMVCAVSSSIAVNSVFRKSRTLLCVRQLRHFRTATADHTYQNILLLKQHCLRLAENAS